VLRGEMALVGPPPEREDTVLRWADCIADYDRRFVVLPGVTGLSQIADATGLDGASIARRTQYDLHYIDHRSLLLDIRMMLRSAAVIVRRPRRLVPAEAPTASAVPTVVKGVTS